MASNPVFDRIDKQITKGDYAGFNRGSSASGMSGGAGVQDSLNSRQLQDLYNQPSAGPVQMRRVTLDDVVMKTLGLFTIVVLVGAATWYYVAGQPSTSPTPMALMLAGMFGGLGVGLLIAFKKTINVPLIVLYSALEGVFVGAISEVFNQRWPGLVATAVIATVCTFAGMFVGWKSGLIKVTDKSRRIFGMAIMGYLLFGLVNLVAAFMGVGSGFGFGGTGPIGHRHLRARGGPGVVLAGDRLRLGRSRGRGPAAREVLLAPGSRADRHPGLAVPRVPASAGPPSPVTLSNLSQTPRSPVPQEVSTELRRVVERWHQLPLDRALSYVGRVRALVQTLADGVARATGVPASEVPDCGPATLMDQLTVMVYDASAAALTSSALTSTLAQDLASLRRELA